jgi:integrase
MPYYLDRRPNGFYRLRGSYLGVPAKDRSLKTRSREQAQAIKESIERKLFEQIVHGKRPASTFAELAVDYMKSGRDLGRQSEAIILDLAEKKLDEITPADCDRIAANIYPGAKPSTVNRWIISPISAIMNWAAASDRAPKRSWPRRRERQAATDWRRPAEMEKIIAAIPSPQARALVASHLGCGLRASESVFMDGREFAPDLTLLRVLGTVRPEDTAALEKGYQGTKGFYDRTVRIPPRARMFMAPVVNTGPGRAFVNSRGMPWADRNALNKTLRRACVKAGVAEMGPHALRHTWATWHNAVHGDLIRLMAEGGWTDLSLVQRYAHATDDALKHEVLDLGWAISGQRDTGGIENGNGNNALSA